VCPRKVHKQGRRKTPRCCRNRKKRLRKKREKHQVLLNMIEVRPRGQLYKRGACTRNLRKTKFH
jgi:hypothetical protein